MVVGIPGSILIVNHIKKPVFFQMLIKENLDFVNRLEESKVVDGDVYTVYIINKYTYIHTYICTYLCIFMKYEHISACIQKVSMSRI